MHDDEPTLLLKRDVLGRTFTPKAQREVLLDEFERSGLKGKPFARELLLGRRLTLAMVQLMA